MSLKSRLAVLLLPLLASTAQAGDIDQAAALTQLAKPDTLLIDVRSADEFASGALPGAHNISHELIAEQISGVAPDKSKPIVLYCRSGRRSGLAQDALQALGYQQVINAGGIDTLKAAQQAKTQEAACTQNC